MAGQPRYWTSERVIAAIRRWHAMCGEHPRVAEWAKADVHHPAHVSVVKAFGSWNAAMEAAGFSGRPQGYPKRNSTAAARSDSDSARRAAAGRSV